MLKSLLTASFIVASSSMAFAANEHSSCQGQFNGFVNDLIADYTDSNGGGLGQLKDTQIGSIVSTNEVAHLRNEFRSEVCSNQP